MINDELIYEMSQILEFYFNDQDRKAKFVYCNGFFFQNNTGISNCSDHDPNVKLDIENIDSPLESEEEQNDVIVQFLYQINTINSDRYFNYLQDDQESMKQILKNNNLQKTQISFNLSYWNQTLIVEKNLEDLLDISSSQKNYLIISALTLVLSLINLFYIFVEIFLINQFDSLVKMNILYYLHTELFLFFQLEFLGELYFKVSNLYTVNGITLIISSCTYVLQSIYTTAHCIDFIQCMDQNTPCYGLLVLILYSLSLFGHYILEITLFIYKNKISTVGLLVYYSIISSFNITRCISYITNQRNQLSKYHFIQQISNSLLAIILFAYLFMMDNVYNYQKFYLSGSIIIGVCICLPLIICIILAFTHIPKVSQASKLDEFKATQYLNIFFMNNLLQNDPKEKDKTYIYCYLFNAKQLTYIKQINTELVQEIKQVIDQQQKKSYKNLFNSKLNIALRYPISNSSLKIQCGICLDEINLDQKAFKEQLTFQQIQKQNLNILFTICGHVFHKECLCKWLENNIECPACRTNLQQ